MEKRRLSEVSDMEVTPIILGAWGIGGPPFWGERDRGESIRTIRAAIDHGINMIDTAPVYGFGLSEKLVGEAVAGRRGDVYIATKVGLRWREKTLGGIYHDLSPASIAEEVEGSLRRLRADRIDLLQVHWPDPGTPVEKTMEALVRLAGQGKIGAIGVCNFSADLLRKALESAPVASIQPKYNMLERDIEANLLPLARELGLGVIVYSPLASGMLSGKYGRGTRFDDWRGRGRMGVFREEAWPAAVERTEKLKKIAGRFGLKLSALAIRWAVEQPGVSAAIVGCNTPAQVAENVEAVGLSIPAEAMEAVREVI